MSLINWDYKYLSDKQLRGFEKYKYACVDTNPLSLYIMHPFWNYTVKFCPLWLAPNLLTFVGFLMSLLGYLILLYYDYNFFASSGGPPDTPTVPPWVFLATSILLFVAYTLDGIDGKQARRTGSSGPLGELFDHGLDSFTSILIPSCLYSVFGRSEITSIPPWRYFFLTWNVFLTFYSTHCEKYSTGVLFLPWGYDLSMISTTLVFLSAWLFGHEAWQIFLTESMSLGHALELVFYLTSFCATLPVSIINVYISFRNKTSKTGSLAESMRPLVCLMTLLFASVFWIFCNPEIVNRHPRIFFLVTGTLFSNITCRLVVSQMSSCRCDVWNWLMLPYLLTAVLNYFIPFQIVETFLIYFVTLGIGCAHLHYGTCVVRQMCLHYKINCFKIIPK